MNEVNYIWRLLATGLCFAIFGLGGIFLSFVVLPLIRFRFKSSRPMKLHIRMLIHRCFRGFINLMSIAGIIEFDIKGAEQQLERSRGKVVIANHPSLIDVVVLIAIIPNADCIIKKQLWNNIFVSRVLIAAGYIKNSEDINHLIDMCRKSLGEGASLIIFPEGTRTGPNGKMLLQRGASNIALRCRADMIPVLIRCEPRTLAKHEKWYKIPQKKVRYSIRAHEPLEISDFETELQSMSIRARRLTDYIGNYYIESMKSYG